jgi:hypothetical protein
VKRSICIWLGFAVVFILTIFPPWVQIGSVPIIAKRSRLGTYPIFRPPNEPTINGVLVSVGYVEVDYRWMLTEIAAGEAFVMALYLTWGRTLPQRVSQSRRIIPESKEQIQEDVDGLIAALRQNLRIKVGWDDARVDRLIAYERERLGNLPLQTLMGAAIDRWERDNR